MNIQKEQNKIKALLDEAMALGNISGGMHAEMQERFSDYLATIKEQQAKITAYQESLKVLPEQVEHGNITTEKEHVLIVDYAETMSHIIDGILEYKKAKLIGKMLLDGSLTLYELQDKEALEARLRMHVGQLAYDVLRHLKKSLGPRLRILEEGREVLTDSNN